MNPRTGSVRLLALALCLSIFIGLNATASNASSTPPPMCATEKLSLGFGEKVSKMTQEQGDFYTLTNRGKVTCFLHGYPRVSYFDKTGHALPFKYTQSSSIYMSHNAPKTVLLRAGALAYFFVAGPSTCDSGTRIIAVTMHVYLANAKKPLIGRSTAYPETGGEITYCTGKEPYEARQLDVSPVRADIHSF